MQKLLSRIKSRAAAEVRILGIGPSLTLILALLPFLIVMLFSALLLLPRTRSLALLLLIETRWLDLLTFVFLITGVVLCLRLLLRIEKSTQGILEAAFYLGLAVVLLFVSLEEVSWGRTLSASGVSRSPTVREEPTDTVIKSIQIWREYMEVFPLSAGLAGILGVLIAQKPYLWRVGSPLLLLPWFAIIAGVSGIDLVHDFYVPLPSLDDLIDSLEEAIELTVGMSAFLFVWLNEKKFLAPKS